MHTSMMQASLPMYDLPEVQEATASWWQGIAKHMRLQGIEGVPDTLENELPLDTLWTQGNLLLSQCCGFDVMNSYKDHLSVLMISSWDAEGCSTGQYYSFIVTAEDHISEKIGDLKNSVAVINGPESHSGMNTLFREVQPYSHDGQFFKTIHISGAHVESLRFIQSKQADVAAIDCVTFELLKRYRPSALKGIKVLCQTKSAPALPYVTTMKLPIEQQRKIQAALVAAFDDPDLADLRETLLLKPGIFPDLSGIQHPYINEENPYREIAEGFKFDPRLLEPIKINQSAQ
jgi:ABC-type phosphate/phosphonate transport system substrate-binding protein